MHQLVVELQDHLLCICSASGCHCYLFHANHALWPLRILSEIHCIQLLLHLHIREIFNKTCWFVAPWAIFIHISAITMFLHLYKWHRQTLIFILISNPKGVWVPLVAFWQIWSMDVGRCLTRHLRLPVTNCFQIKFETWNSEKEMKELVRQWNIVNLSEIVSWKSRIVSVKNGMFCPNCKGMRAWWMCVEDGSSLKSMQTQQLLQVPPECVQPLPWRGGGCLLAYHTQGWLDVSKPFPCHTQGQEMYSVFWYLTQGWGFINRSHATQNVWDCE